MHMASIRVRYGFRWHSDKPYRTSRRRVQYGLSECHLNTYRTRMDIICIFSHEITLNLSFTTKKCIIEPPLRYGVRSELCLTLKHNRGVREWYLVTVQELNVVILVLFINTTYKVQIIEWCDYYLPLMVTN